MLYSIQEIPISNPNRKRPLFIEYSKEIHDGPLNRLRFLRALLKIVDLNEAVIHYDKLGLSQDDIPAFRLYMEAKYPDICRTHKKFINMDDFDGKIICNIDLLINDIFETLEQKEIEDMGSEKKILPSGNETQIISDDGNIKLRDDLKKPLNKHILEILNFKISLSETHIFVDKILKETNPEDIETIFNYSDIGWEIDKIPQKIKNKQINFEDETIVREILIKIIKELATRFSNKQYWEKLSIDIDRHFVKILQKCDQEKLTLSFENGKKYDLTLNEILLNDAIKIFQAIPGTLDQYNRNEFISEYQKKKALFNSNSVVTKEISLDDLVLAEIIGSGDTFVIINPLKILTDTEASKLLSLDIEGYPSTDKILSKLSEAKE